jgi:hypothetical protein
VSDSAQLILDIIRILAPHDLGRDVISYSWRDCKWDGQKTVPCEPHYLATVECSDQFWWASADCEVVTPENFPLLESTLLEAEAIDKANPGSMAIMDALLLFVARVRNMRPMAAAYKDIESTIRHLVDAVGPERDGEWWSTEPHLPSIAVLSPAGDVLTADTDVSAFESPDRLDAGKSDTSSTIGSPTRKQSL